MSMHKLAAILSGLLLAGCDSSSQSSTGGSLRGIRLEFAERGAHYPVDSLRLSVSVDGHPKLDAIGPLSNAIDSNIEALHGSAISVHARVFMSGDTSQLADTAFSMPASDDVYLVLKLRSIAPTRPWLASAPTSSVHLGDTYLDTLYLAGPGADSTVVSLISGPSGMILANQRLEWTPGATGRPTVKLGLTLRDSTDTLSFSIDVDRILVAPPGMVTLNSNGASWILGSGLDSGIAPTRVSLTNDFAIDRTEITQFVYDSVMGAAYPGYIRPGWTDSSAPSRGFPAYNVSFHDAALFCNARSRKAGLDTCYAYTGLAWSGFGSTLQNLSVRRRIRGFRLPTEAEWDFAARGGSDSLRFWKAIVGAKSSSYANYPTAIATGHLSKVGLLQPDAAGLHDMFGNLGELVTSVHRGGNFVPDSLDPWGPGIWNWGGGWNVAVRGGSYAASTERTFLPASFGRAEVGFRTAISGAAGGQGSARPGLVPRQPLPGPDSTFAATVGQAFTLPFELWDLHGQTMTLFVNAPGPTTFGASVVWTPAKTDIGDHLFLVAAQTPDSRTSEPFRLKVLVK